MKLFRHCIAGVVAGMMEICCPPQALPSSPASASPVSFSTAQTLSAVKGFLDCRSCSGGGGGGGTGWCFHVLTALVQDANDR